MKNLKLPLLCLLSFLCSDLFLTSAYAQPDWNLLNYSLIQNNFKIPASPQASNFMRYDNNYDVGFYSGAAQMSVPVTSIGDGSLSLPINLSYTATGIKVDALPGWVGLGWNLSTGGVITKTVIGHPDSKNASPSWPSYFNTNAWPSQSTELANNIDERVFLRDQVSNKLETQPDIYDYSFGPYSGQFIIKTDGTIMNSEKNYLKFNLTRDAINGFVNPTITVTDPSGFIYTFAANEKTHYQYETISGQGPIYTMDFISAWYLTEIKHPNVNEGKIVLSYTTIAGTQYLGIGLETIKTQTVNFASTSCCSSSNGFGTSPVIDQYIYERKIINKIQFYKNNEEIEYLNFTTSLNTALNSYNSYKIDRIDRYVKSNTSVEIQKYFTFTYQNNTSLKRLVLLNLQEFGANAASFPPYAFEYESGSLPDPYGPGVDFWGYANNSSGGLIHPHCNYPSTTGNTDRTANSAGSAGTLNKIIYPTGGYTKYTYEGHDTAPFSVGSCSTNPSNGLPYNKVGGVRIKLIEHYNKNNTLAARREYKYVKADGSTSGLSLNTISNFQINTYNYEIAGCIQGGSCANQSCTSMTLNPNALYFDNYFQKGHVGYTRVEEIIKTNTASSATAGKNVYTFYNVDYTTSAYRRNGELLKTEVFNDANVIMQKVENQYYLDLNTNSIDSYRNLTAIGESFQSDLTMRCKLANGTFIWRNAFDCPTPQPTCTQSDLFETRLKRKIRNFSTFQNYVLKTTTTTYPESPTAADITNDNKIVQEVNYEYNTTNALVPSKVSTINSDNALYDIRTTYATSGDLFTKNMFTTPVTVEKFVDNVRVYGYKNIYATLNGNLKLNAVQEAFGAAGAYVNNEEFNYYDLYGLAREYKKTYDQENAVIYYSKTAVISAIIKNAKNNEVAYSSFETAEPDAPPAPQTTATDGRWKVTLAGLGYADKAGASGHGYYNLTNANTLYNLSVPVGSYILSYYTKTPAQVSVAAYAGSALTNLSTETTVANANGWILVEKIINFTSGGQVAISATTAAVVLLDELRLYPYDALMKTACYDKKSKLVMGLGDESASLTRFEYDNLYRLIGTYDHNDHMVQNTEYQYNMVGFDQNTITNRQILTSGVANQAAANALTGANMVKSFAYFDGLGRPIQKITLDYSTALNDQVVHMDYDEYGRQTNAYMPYTINSAATTYNAAFRTSPLTEQQAFYNGLFTGDGGFAKENNVIEKSPLARVKQVIHAGSSWQAKASETKYKLNVASEVRIATFANSYYAVNTLMKTESLDEDLKSVITYTDRIGRTVMVDKAGAKTYYLYNSAGLISQVIQPQGSAILHSTPSTIHTAASIIVYSFLYTYDEQYRLATKKMPGTSAVYDYKYDALDRIVLETDPKGFKTFHKYDILGREIMSGRYTGTASPLITDGLYENKTTSGHFYTTGLSFPLTSTEIYTVNYFDDYNYNSSADYVKDVSYQASPSAAIASFDYPFTFSINHPSTNTHLIVRGKPTRSKVGMLNQNDAAPTVFVTTDNFYDKYTRLIQQKTAHAYSGFDVEWIAYNFQGWELVRSREHNAVLAGSNKNLFTTKRNTYDHIGRVVNKYITIYNGGETLLSSSTYTEIDQLKVKTLGAGLQNVDYKYNIRGWLTDINDVDNCNTDYFRMRLNYITANANVNGAANWNSNISSIEWKVGNACTVSSVVRNKALYGFTYDSKNRLQDAKYAEYNGSAYVNIDNYNENLMYNDNGDITSLKRRGKSGASFALIDDLSYTYASSGTYNLTTVNDVQSTTLGFTTTASTSNTYTYDANGNMTGKTNATFGAYYYNYLDLPKQMSTSTVSTASNVLNTYDAAGRKWQSSINGLVTTYFGDIEYVSNNLQAMYHEDGRIVPLSASTFEHHFYIKDHLGSTRVIFKAGGILMQEYHCYPFGMAQEGSWVTSTGLAEKYKFNGKELYQSGLNLADYGARWYDATIGRWTSIDPMAEKYIGYSPYHFSGNNPMAFVDYNGADFTGNGLFAIEKTARARNAGGSTMMGTSESLAQAENLGDIRYDRDGKDDKKANTGDEANKNEQNGSEEFDQASSGDSADVGDNGCPPICDKFDRRQADLEAMTPEDRKMANELTMEAIAYSIPIEGLFIKLFKWARLARATKGVSVIGPRATYREFAKKIGANFLDVTDEAWTMRKNVDFLQGVIKRADDVIFSGQYNPARLDPKSVLAQEIRYLQRHGYSWTKDFSRMIKK